MDKSLEWLLENARKELTQLLFNPMYYFSRAYMFDHFYKIKRVAYPFGSMDTPWRQYMESNYRTNLETMGWCWLHAQRSVQEFQLGCLKTFIIWNPVKGDYSDEMSLPVSTAMLMCMLKTVPEKK